MRRIIKGLVVAGTFLVFSIPGTAFAHCPETELARIVCSLNGSGRIYVCQDHHGIITVHHHCPR